MKRIIIALSCIGLSTSVLAGSYKDQVVAPVGVNLVAPETTGLWTIGFQANYVQASGNEFTYGQLAPVVATSSRTFDRQTVSNHSEWGGSIDIDYKFAQSSRDVKLSYTFYDLDNAKTTQVGNNQQLIAPINLNGGVFPFTVLLNGSNAKGSVDNDLDAVDLVFGQSIKVGDRVGLHPFAGLRWAYISNTDKARYNSIFNDNYVQNQLKLESEFQGIGPRAGIDASVQVGAGISLIGTAGASLLVGDLDSKINNDFFGIFNTQNSATHIKNDDNRHVVPELDARLGVNYAFDYFEQTKINVQVGYQAVNYFDVIDVDFIDQNTPNTISNSGDFGYYGPYLRAEFSFQ